jgi:allantoinase
MPHHDLALRSTRVVTPEGERPGVVLVGDGRIVDVVAPSEAPPDTEDLGDLALLAGFVDSHVHVNDPGRAHWEGFDTATRAAAVGGITTLVDMPLNSLPPTTTAAALATKLAAADGRLHVDVAFWGGIVPGSEPDITELHSAGVMGFKVFTCDSGVPEYGSFAPEQLVALLERTGPLGVPLIVHAEDPATLREAAATAAAAASASGSTPDPRAYRTWLESRPSAAEDAAVTALLDAVRATGARAHVLHLSAASALPRLADARAEGLPITVETCPHYLTLTAEDIPDGATDHKCAPPIRDRANRERLWDALADGTIDAVVSDHSPSSAEDKHLEDGDIMAAWGGIASVQLGPSLIWTAARARGFGLTDLSRWMAAGPARIAGLRHKGRLVPGAEADLVVFDPDAPWTVDAAALHHRHPITPYHGRAVTGAVRRTYLRGACIMRDGELLGPAAGRPRRRDEV